MSGDALRLSIVVPTRNRADDVSSCVESILGNPGGDFELIVVDQSDGDQTSNALHRFVTDTRLRITPSDTRGASSSRNVGIAASLAPIVAFTDDDCRVPADWVDTIAKAFDERSDVGAMFGRVTVPAELLARGFAAQFSAEPREYQHCFPDAGAPWGLSANMAVRRSILNEVGTFDPLLGAGARFPGGEEMDLTIRILAAGYKVLETSAFQVVHLGLREGKDVPRLLRGYARGIGAAYAKHLRLGTKNSGQLFAKALTHHGLDSTRRALAGERSLGLSYLGCLLLGAMQSVPQAIDRSRFVYRKG